MWNHLIQELEEENQTPDLENPALPNFPILTESIYTTGGTDPGLICRSVSISAHHPPNPDLESDGPDL